MFSHQGWGEAHCPLLSAQDCSPEDPHVLWAPSQGTPPAKIQPPPVPSHSFRNCPGEGRRMRGKEGAPSPGESLQRARLRGAVSSRVSAEPLGLI